MDEFRTERLSKMEEERGKGQEFVMFARHSPASPRPKTETHTHNKHNTHTGFPPPHQVNENGLSSAIHHQ